MAGGFNVHDTEAAEAYHKQCMGLAAHRVRHLSMVATHNSMLSFLQKHLLFKSMVEQNCHGIPKTQQASAGVRVPLLEMIGFSVQPVRMGRQLSLPAQQTRIIHHELRITKLELLDMLCKRLQLPTTTNTYTLLESLDWSFGQKLTMSDGEVYWATDSKYSFTTDSSSKRQRRDNLLLHGTEDCKVTLSDGTVTERATALCCQAISFVTIRNLLQTLKDVNVPLDIKNEIQIDKKDKNKNSLTLMIVRWFEPHPHAFNRDFRNLPTCPGLFHINHCLWRYARTKRPRRVLWDSGKPTQVFHDQCFMFGNNAKQQLDRLRNESHAYYALIKISSIKQRVHMAPEFEEYTSVESSTWLQTVTLV